MAESVYLEAHNTVNQIKTALENITDPLEIDGLVLRLDYLKAYESYYEGESLIPIRYLKRALEVILQENSFQFTGKTTSKHMAQPLELKWQ